MLVLMIGSRSLTECNTFYFLRTISLKLLNNLYLPYTFYLVQQLLQQEHQHCSMRQAVAVNLINF